MSRKDSRSWNEYIQRYHYLGFTPLPGAQIRYFVTTQERLVALLGFGASAWQTAPRVASSVGLRSNGKTGST